MKKICKINSWKMWLKASLRKNRPPRRYLGTTEGSVMSKLELPVEEHAEAPFTISGWLLIAKFIEDEFWKNKAKFKSMTLLDALNYAVRPTKK